jgi:hypothetical protein
VITAQHQVDNRGISPIFRDRKCIPANAAKPCGQYHRARRLGGNRSALVATAIRDYLDRLAIEAAIWHASLTGEEAAVFKDFNAAP